MVKVVTSIEIHVPMAIVSKFANEPDNAPLWYKNIRSVIWKSNRPLKPGSQIVFVAHFLGKKLEYTYEVIELSPQKMSMQTQEGPFPMKTTYEWLDLGNQKTKMILTNEGKPSGFSRWITPFMSMMMRKANKKDLKLLKDILEKEKAGQPLVTNISS